MQQSTITPYFPSGCRLMAIACLCLFLSLIDSALGAIFLPTPEELKDLLSDRSGIIYPAARLDLNRLPRKTDGEKSYVVVDDMLFDISTIQPNGAVSGNLWPGGIVYYLFDSNVSSANRAQWLDAATEWNGAANLRFLEGTGNGNYILVQSSNENSSQVGMTGLGQQIMKIVSWDSKFRIAHEIGHALGLIHEQSRSDRDNYVVIFWNNILPGREHNFYIWQNGMTIYGAYDFDSVMHYARADFSQNGQDTIEPVPAYFGYVDTMGQRTRLSQLDRSAMAQRYGGPQSCPSSITQSSSQAIATGNSVSCNTASGHADNSYWRAFNMASFTGSQQFTVSSVSFGVEEATGLGGTQPVMVRLYTNGGGAFPGGTRTQIATTTIQMLDSAAGTVLSVPLVANVPAGTSELVMEVFTPNGQATGNFFFIGSNAAAETGPSYLSAAGCDINTPTPTANIGFPNMHIVFNVNGSCAGTTPTPTPPPQGSLVVTSVNGLPAAVAYANANPSIPNKTISFNLPEGGPWTLMINSPLTITTSVKIDGASQPGYNGAANRVYVEGAVGVANIFDIRNHSGTTIKGLGIYYYDSTGVSIDNANGVWIEDCYIGFKQTSSGVVLNRVRAPFSTGIGIRGSLNQVHRSTVSGVYNGIIVGESNDQVTGFVSNDNLFEGNNIGSDPTGQTTVGYENTATGMLLRAGVKYSWIGSWTLDPEGFNVIAGNGGSGIEISHPTDDHNRIFYNYFGVNRGGTRLITGNTNQQAILLNNGTEYNAAWGNIIAGNRGGGIIIESSRNWVLGNTIGLNQAQTQALSGQPYGVILRVDNTHTPGATPQGNAIGGSGAGNMICSQSFNGMEIDYGAGNGVMCNWIGINGSGQSFPNAGWGVYLLNSSGNSSYGCLNAWGPNGLGRVGGSGGCCNSIQ